jgi:hypothetical protein
MISGPVFFATGLPTDPWSDFFVPFIRVLLFRISIFLLAGSAGLLDLSSRLSRSNRSLKLMTTRSF